MVKNKKYFTRMFLLGLVVCTSSVFVKGVVSDEEEKETPTSVKYGAYRKKGEKWIKNNDKEINKEIKNDIFRAPDKSLEIMKAFEVGPNYMINNSDCACPCTIAGNTFKQIIKDAGEGECNISLAKTIFDLEVDIDKKTGWIWKSKSVRDVIMYALGDCYSTDLKQHKCYNCAKKIADFLLRNKKNKNIE